MSVEKAAHWTLLVVLLLGAFALRVYYLTHDRFHADEALYAGWALRILDDDPLLLDESVDKPPLYLYFLAASMRLLGTSEVAARWPNLAASMLNVALLYRLARRLYDRSTGTCAAFFLACSPYAVLFARTAFTDPLLVTWIFAALNLIATGCPPLAPPDGGRTWAPPPKEAGRGPGYHPPLAPLLDPGAQGPRAGGRRTWTPPPVGEVGWGLFFGLALATKQHALFLLPLLLCLAWVLRPAHFRRPWPVLRSFLLALLGFALPYALVTWWDAQRWAIRPGFWQQSVQSYGGLRWAPIGEWGSRLIEWLGWGRYLVGSPLLYVSLGLGSAVLLLWGWRQERRAAPWRVSARMPALDDRPQCSSVGRASLPATPTARTDSARQSVRLDRLWAGYGVAYLIAHVILGFSIWDRYLLPLAPLASMLLARIVVTGYRWLHVHESTPTGRGRSRAAPTHLQLFPKSRSGLRYAATAWVLVFCIAAVVSGALAARNGYPIGGEHWAYQGLDEIVAYLKTHAPPDAVLYHHWLRWHYTYYLHDINIELRYWQSDAHLAQEVARTPNRVQYLVLPDWGSAGFSVDGVALESLYEAQRGDGSTSLRLYRVRRSTDPSDCG